MNTKGFHRRIEKLLFNIICIVKRFSASLCISALFLAGGIMFQECGQNAEQAKDQPQTVKMDTSFFPASDLMKTGVFYYPEQWPKEQWKRDFTNMAHLGFEFTHLAEFSWTFLEPEDGKFDFGWLDEAIDLADRAGLKVILCTPSLAPPAWMGEKHPEIYLVGSDGIRREHGSRANASLSNSVYRKYVKRIVQKLGEHYGKDARILGWQVDNEPLALSDYSPSARVAFQKWLKERYVSIDKLNAVWGGSFWSTRYLSFEQVLIPNAAMNNEDKLSPHALLDFQRFTAEVTAGFLNEQADILRKFIRPSVWITTNYTNAITSADPRLSDHLDFPSFTMYPVNGKNILGGNNFRTGNPYRIMEACDYFRSVKGITGVMEMQPGQVNWAPVNPQLEPGTVHMWLMQAFGGGCSFASTYRYRHPVWGSEMYHEGIVGTDGVTLTEGGKEFVQAIEEIKMLRKHYDRDAKMPESLAKRKTGFLWENKNMWDLEIQPQTTQWDTWKLRNTYTSIIKSAGAPTDIISEKADFNSYPFIVAPAYQLISDELVDKWQKYVMQGGHLILTCRSGQKDNNGHFFEAKPAEPIASLIGADLMFYDMLPGSVSAKVSYRNREYSWSCWSEILKPHKGTEILATYSDQYYAGRAAATMHRLGKGTVTFIGAVSDDGLLEKEIVRSVYFDAGVNIENLPAGVYLEWRNGFMVAVNYSDRPYKLRIPEEKEILVGSNPLKSAQAIVWKE
jgi:beta-galactosidase